MNIHPIHAGNAAETPMPLAPCIELDNGMRCIPQHYLQYRQTVETVSEILHDIGALEDILLFCGDDAHGLYLQVGVIGPDNYNRAQDRPQRMVYGRKWRIEHYTPTSEVIQTALLAVKKACEHEVRELFTIDDADSGKVGTPFTTHVDLPLMARYPELVLSSGDDDAPCGEWLQGVCFAGRALCVQDKAVRGNGSIVLDLSLGGLVHAHKAHRRYGDDPLELTLVLTAWDQASLLHAVMNALIQHSDRLVDEQFSYRGLVRFSRAVNPVHVSRLSLATRTRGLPHGDFEPVRKRINFDIDVQRAPSLGAGRLAERNRQALAALGRLGGHMPHDWAGLDATLHAVTG